MFHVKHYFNSQPHEEADVSSDVLSQSITISTHSLTKRLTVTNNGRILYRVNFNSQPHEEADSKLAYVFRARNISTHSLTKRLTVIRLHYF